MIYMGHNDHNFKYIKELIEKNSFNKYIKILDATFYLPDFIISKFSWGCYANLLWPN